MQERQHNRELYFKELALTSRTYYLPYIARFKRMERGMNVLEVGCGEGGNLLPFAETGCNVTGVDLSENRIKDAIRFFAEQQAQGTFIASDIFLLKGLEHSFDLILCHDVIEHIERKAAFLSDLKHYLKPGGIVFMSFPAWQMPFGGHQQICRNKVISHLPFIHLLPSPLQGHPESGRRNPSTHRGTAFYQTNTDIDRAVRETGEAGVYPRRQAALLHKSPLRSEIRAEAPQAAGTHCQHSLREEFLHNFLLLSVEMTDIGLST